MNKKIVIMTGIGHSCDPLTYALKKQLADDGHEVVFSSEPPIDLNPAPPMEDNIIEIINNRLEKSAYKRFKPPLTRKQRREQERKSKKK